MSKPELLVLRDSNFRQVAPTLRKIADMIEAGEYGDVSEAALVLLGDKCEVFGMGRDAEGDTIVLLLQAGAHRMIREVANYGRE
jgi:hypothetical protein